MMGGEQKPNTHDIYVHAHAAWWCVSVLHKHEHEHKQKYENEHQNGPFLFSMLYDYAAFPCCMSTLHVQADILAAFPCCMSVLHANATYTRFLRCPCPRLMFWLLIHGACPVHVHAAYSCCISVLYVHAACPCCLSMLNVNAACQCYLSMLNEHENEHKHGH